jgi:hypothetical protein
VRLAFAAVPLILLRQLFRTIEESKTVVDSDLVSEVLLRSFQGIHTPFVHHIHLQNLLYIQLLQEGLFFILSAV